MADPALGKIERSAFPVSETPVLARRTKPLPCARKNGRQAIKSRFQEAAIHHDINPAALVILRGAESCRLKAYPDPGSGGAPWTIGWGATGPDVRVGVVWTQAQANARLVQDLDHLAGQMTLACGTSPTSANQFGAMCSLAYNIGFGAFSSSSVLRFHRAGKHHDAAAAFAPWDKGGGRVLPGLVRRRAAEAALYLTLNAALGSAT